uniref:Cl3204_1 n=1 Tax=Arundo donax TaxID=35708 RepID=A0A0A9E1H8_ARUDO
MHCFRFGIVLDSQCSCNQS